VFLPYEMLRQWVPVGVFLKIALLQFLALKCYANGYLLVCIQEKALLVFLAFEMLRQRAPVGVFTRKSAASVPCFEMLRQWVPVGVYTRKSAASVPCF